MKSIQIDAEPVEQISAKLVGKAYVVTPPKGALGLKLAASAKEAQATGDVEVIWGEVLGWVKMAVGKKQADDIQARLDDPEDALDIIHVINLMEKVVEAVTDNPTSSSSD